MNESDREKYALIAENVVKNYRSGFFGREQVPALKGITLHIPKGGIYGLLGPNGAGKTTMINVFAGQLQADSGIVCVLGHTFSSLKRREFEQLKVRMNMCSGAPNFPWSFTLFEVLNFYAMLYGMPGKERKRRIDEYIKLFDLGQWTDKQFDSLSTGTKQKVALAKALISDPEILFLDEPTIGLDPDIANRIRRMIKDINAKRRNTIVLTSHYMKEVEELCGRIAFIKNGEIIAEGTSAELKEKTKSTDMEGVFLELSHQDMGVRLP